MLQQFDGKPVIEYVNYVLIFSFKFNQLLILDQKQFYRLNETKSHWNLNPPPPGRMRHLKVDFLG